MGNNLLDGFELNNMKDEQDLVEGFDLSTMTDGGSKIEQQSKTPSVIKDDLLSGFEINDGGSNVEQSLEESSSQFDWGDYLKGSLIETPLALGVGAASFVSATGFRHAAVAGQKVQQALGIVPKMTPEEQAQMGDEVFNYVQSFGGLIEPKTKSAKAGLELVGKVFEPLNKFSHFIAKGIDKDKYPNAHNAVASGIELGTFALIPKVAGIAKKIGKEKIGRNKPKGDVVTDGELTTLFDATEEALAKGHVSITSLENFALAKNKYQVERTKVKESTLNKQKKKKAVAKLDSEFKAYEEGVKKSIKEHTKIIEAEQIKMTAKQKQAQIEGAENISRGYDVVTKEGLPVEPEFKPLIDLERPNTLRERTMKENAEWVDRQRGLQEQMIKGTTGIDVLNKVPKNKIVEEPTLGEHRIMALPGQSVQPKRVYRINNEGKAIYMAEESTVLPSREYKAELGSRTELIKKMEESKVWHSFFEPLKNEKGSFPVELSEMSSKNRERLRQFGKLAEDAGMKMDEFLRTKGMDADSIKKIVSLHEKAREENPWRSSKSELKKQSLDSDILSLRDGEAIVNLSKDANAMVKIGERFFNELKILKHTVTPGIIKGFTTGLQSFNKLNSPAVKEIYHWWKDNNLVLTKDKVVVAKQIENLSKRYSNRKLREEAGVAGMARSESGLKAIELSGKTMPKGEVKYEGLIKELDAQFEDLYNRINETRISIGKKPLKKLEHYLPFFAQETFFDKLGKTIKGDKSLGGRSNLVMDSADSVNYRHSKGVADATNLAHVKRQGLRRGIKLELDPLKLYAKYANTALDHIHISPINAFIKEITSKRLKDPKTGKTYDMGVHNPELRDFLGTWSNNIAGVPNLDLPRWLDTSISKVSKNLTAATLYYSLRTILVQPSALLSTVTEFGPSSMIKGVMDTIVRKKVPIEKSRELPVRVADVFLTDIAKEFAGTRYEKVTQKIDKYGVAGMKFVDYVAAEVTWRTAYNKVSKKMTERDAIRFADEAVVRTQGSGARGDLSPIQMNALGKAVTLWQTFTINHANFIAKDVLGIKNPEVNPMETAKRVATYVVGSAMVSTLFEDVLGIQSPQPAPIKAIIKGLENGDDKAVIALNAMMELSEIVPMLGTLKYGGHPGGAVLNYFGELTSALSGNEVFNKDLLPKAMDGDKKSMVKIAELVGKGLGARGTGQGVKYVRGRDRGESVVGSLLGRYDSSGKGSGSSRSGRSSRSNR